MNILAAQTYREVFTSKEEYNTLVKKFHPDISTDKKASEIMQKLNEFKKIYDEGYKFKDESGDVVVKDLTIEFNGNSTGKSYSNYTLLKSKDDKDHFHKYMPKVVNNSLYSSEYRIVPLLGLKLPHEHVNWILSRLLEYCSWLEEIGYVHCGINPKSVFIVPETHGIIISSYYHLTPLNRKVETINGEYINWYPSSLFKDKIAKSSIDIRLCKSLIIYLLGDKSGAGTKLKREKKVNQNMLSFLLENDTQVFTTYKKYRKLLKSNFPSKFHKLNI